MKLTSRQDRASGLVGEVLLGHSRSAQRSAQVDPMSLNDIRQSHPIEQRQPKERIRLDPQEELGRQKQYVRDMAKKFGWKVTTGR